jgi:hypothetical protein
MERLLGIFCQAIKFLRPEEGLQMLATNFFASTAQDSLHQILTIKIISELIPSPFDGEGSGWAEKILKKSIHVPD